MGLKKLLLVKSNSKYGRDSINFEDLDYEIINANILEIEELPLEKLSDDNQTIIITSMNAIFALEKLNISKDNQIFTVGKVSAKILADLGYKNIIFGKNSAQSLLDQIITKKQIAKNQKILYLSGEKITIDIAQKLREIGYDATRKIVYKIHSSSLAENIKQDLQNNEINDIALFSKNGAEIFFNLCQQENIDLSRKKILCLSQNIADYCKELGFVGKIEKSQRNFRSK
jgi:uroporphyrinogen-III synthase